MQHVAAVTLPRKSQIPRLQSQLFRREQTTTSNQEINETRNTRCKRHPHIFEYIGYNGQKAMQASASGSERQIPPDSGPAPSANGGGLDRRANKQIRSGFMRASQAQAAPASTTPEAPSLPIGHFRRQAGVEREADKKTKGLAIEVDHEDGITTHPDPL